jgi:hypothetical protein
MTPTGIQNFLLDFSSAGARDRKDLAAGATVLKVGAVALTGLGSLVCALIFRPVLACISVVLLGVAGYETFMIARNTENLMDHLPLRLQAASTNRQFVTTLFKDTLFVKPLFGNMIAREMDTWQ